MTTTTDTSVAEGITEQFIGENQVEVILQRRTKQPTTAGGFKWSAPTSLRSQGVRVVKSPTPAQAQQTNSDGQLAAVTATMVARLDADIEVFDQFSLDDKTYELVTLLRRPLFGRYVAELVERG